MSARSIDWGQIEKTDPINFDVQTWWVARHEAAHFVVALHYPQLIILNVWLKTRRNGFALPGQRSILGAVNIFEAPIPGYIICTCAGPIADKLIRGREWCLADPGYRAEIEQARDEIRDAMKNPWNIQMRLANGREPTGAEVKATLIDFMRAAYNILNSQWNVVEIVAKVFLLSITAKGMLDGKRLSAVIDMTRYMLRGGVYAAWVQAQREPKAVVKPKLVHKKPLVTRKLDPIEKRRAERIAWHRARVGS